jgi:uncharacterized protein (TIGR00661 family)
VRILYGIQGTGNGHLSRSREIIRELVACGHDLAVIVSGRAGGSLPDLGLRSPPRMCRGLTFSTKAGRIRLLASAAGLRPLQLARDLRSLDDVLPQPDLVISDFEPVSAWWARRRGVRSLGIGHQYAFVHPVPLPPGHWGGRQVLRHFAPVDVPLGLHWDPFGHPLLPPVVPEMAPAGAPEPDLILVYLPFESRQAIAACLAPLREWRFLIYGHPAGLPDQSGPDHLAWRPFSREDFLADLRRCAGVICSAGFELPSEVIHLGRRLLVKPLAGQLEQLANAMAIEQLGLGEVMRSLDSRQVDEWMARPAPPARRWPHVARHIARWVTESDRCQPAELARECWRETG